MRPNTGDRKRCCRSILSTSNKKGPQRLLHKRKQLSFLMNGDKLRMPMEMTRWLDGLQSGRCFACPSDSRGSACKRDHDRRIVNVGHTGITHVQIAGA